MKQKETNRKKKEITTKKLSSRQKQRNKQRGRGETTGG